MIDDRDIWRAAKVLMAVKPIASIGRGFFLVALCVVAFVLTAASSGRADQTVNLDLVLAIDASGTVDSAEFELQTRGLAEAFRHPDVIAAIQATGARGIAVAVVQWSGRGQQVVAVDWTPVADEASSKALAMRIEDAGRRLIGGTTVIDRALLFCVGLLASSPFQSHRKVIDISGDGKTNYGPPPDFARDQALAAGITINGLAILNEVADLAQYYRDHVVGGVGSFLMTTRDYRDFASAIRLKLIREILNSAVAARPEGSTGWRRISDLRPLHVGMPDLRPEGAIH